MTAPKTILVPTDFSETAKAALAYGKFLAEEFGASLHVLHVLHSPFTYVQGLEASPEMAYLREEMSREAGTSLEHVLTPQERKQLNARLTTMWGIPYVEITDYAGKNDVDLIVMGTHGRGPIQRLLLGSVADKVVRRAPCPVLTVRLPRQPTEELQDEGSSHNA
jgi:nucleotide-binding universal stress UspA family protein